MDDTTSRTYAGVLGKIIGVYLGRPVEGWPYADIVDRFGTLTHYVNDRLGIPVVTADDDISGSFAFSRAVVDHGDGTGGVPSAEQVGQTWLNYVVEDRTILWWGGRGRSTEHTAFLNLAAGVPAPESGSAARNGSVLPVQVGAQIFVDAFAMMSPGDPDRAAATARAAASVSHDGAAVEAAVAVAVMEAAAFVERDVTTLVETARGYVQDPSLLRVIDDVTAWCADEDDWRAVRDKIEHAHGYSRYAGPCPVTTNHAAVLASLLLGGDSFLRSVSVAASAGWDTDSNAGVVGALTGIRLGLDALDAECDLRTPVADQLLVVTADGGECVSDAVQQTRAIAAGRAVLDGRPVPPRAPRFGFELPGAVQGFGVCTAVSSPYVRVSVDNPGGTGLRVTCAGLSTGTLAAVSTPVHVPRPGPGDNFSTLASPTLYPGQTVRARVRREDTGPAHPGRSETTVQVHLYVVVDGPNGPVVTRSPDHLVTTTASELAWLVPDTGADPLARVGLAVTSEGRLDGTVVVERMDWSGAPTHLSQSGVVMTSIWDLAPEPLRAWVSSAADFEADFVCTYSVSHPHGTGIVTTGTRDWEDYAFASRLVLTPHERAGVVVRAQGHRRWYGAVLTGGRTVSIVRNDHGTETVLASAPWATAENDSLTLALRCHGPHLTLSVDGQDILSATDTSPRALDRGGAGYLVTTGTVLADGFTLTSDPTRLTDPTEGLTA